MRVYFFALCILIWGCKKRETGVQPPYNTGNLSINITYSVDAQPLSWNDLVYKNEAGNEYSISKLQYYLSDFRFYKNNILLQGVDSVFYIDANISNTNNLLFRNINSEKYDSVSFCIGVMPAKNSIGGLPATVDNNNMVWPDMMGGGYHFLKLEGHWKDTTGLNGFAMHLGKNGFQCFTGLKCKIDILPQSLSVWQIKMNINEWFRTPNVYNFSTDGVYTMGNDLLMQKIKENGVNVFSIL
ncbi:MAG: hypothetical protein JST82_02685 [Bacteroidetes bacterium]|nr:hypothetical protein [Bacteroidota bacterium]